jgi:hypothetical protein
VTIAEAVDELAERIDAREFPEIPDATLTSIVQRNAYVTKFVASSAYASGQLLLPSSASLDAPGAAYVVVAGGVAGSEPTWPTTRGVPVASGGVTLTWWGVYGGTPWDLQEATREGLKQKIRLCAKLIESAAPGTKRSYQQMREGYDQALKSLGPSARGWI